MAQGIFLPFPQHQRCPLDPFSSWSCPPKPGLQQHCRDHPLCLSPLPFTLCCCQGPTSQLQEDRQNLSVCNCSWLNLLSDRQGLQPYCTHLGRNHIISKNQVICNISLQGHGDGVESVRGRCSEANAWRLGQSSPATPEPGISGPVAAPQRNLEAGAGL